MDVDSKIDNIYFTENGVLFIMVRILPFFFLLLLSSCYISMPQREKMENILPQPSLDESIDESLATSYFSMGDWPQESWWELFDSPQLNALVEEALVQNPTLQEVGARLNVAYQESIISHSILIPWLSLDITDGKELLSHNGLYKAFNPTLPLSANLVDVFLTLQLDLDFWGKNRHLFFAALSETQAQSAELAQARLIVTTALVEAYVAWKSDLLRKAVYQRIADISSKLFELQKLLQNKALFSALTVLSGEQVYLEAEKLVFQIDQQVATDKHLVNILLGRGPDAPLPDDHSLPALPQSVVIPCNLSLDLVARRPDLIAQIWRVEALSHEVGAAIGEFYPDVNFSLLLGFESTSFTKLFDWQSKMTKFAPAFHLPIFTAGAIGANVKANKAAFDEAVFAYNSLVLASAQQVADDLVEIRSVFSQSIDQKGVVESAKKRYELTRSLKNSGLNSIFDVYNVELELLNSELVDIDLIYQKYIATVKLIKALGGGWTHG